MAKRAVLVAIAACGAACGARHADVVAEKRPTPTEMPRSSEVFGKCPARADATASDGPSSVHIGLRRGNPADATPAAMSGPGLILEGGGKDIAAVHDWAGALTGHGDLIVLTAASPAADEAATSGTAEAETYDGWLCPAGSTTSCAGRYNSVQLIRLPAHAAEPCAHTTAHWTKGDWVAYAKALDAIDHAEVVFFSGGDQHDYSDWPCDLFAAVDRVTARKGVIGGTSAGMAIQGAITYDSRAADQLAGDDGIGTEDAVAAPASAAISFSRLLHSEYLGGVLTDTHFIARDRMGRLGVFLARLGAPTRAIACDQTDAVLIDAAGRATLKQGADRNGACFFLDTSHASFSTATPFAASGIDVQRLDQVDGVFDLKEWRLASGAPSFKLAIDARKTPIYLPADPYRPAMPPGAAARNRALAR